MDMTIIEKLRKDLLDKTQKVVEQVNGNYKLKFGQGVIFRISPIGSTYVLLVFRQTFFDQGIYQDSQLIKDLCYRIKHLIISEPKVIEVDTEIHIERPKNSYRTSSM